MNLLPSTFDSAEIATAPLAHPEHDRLSTSTKFFAIVRFVIGGALYVGSIFVVLISLALSLLALGYASRN